MPVQFIITESKFFNQHKNGVDFLSNTTDFTNNLVGNVGEKMRHFISFEIGWLSAPDASNPWTVSATRITRTNGSFSDDGFYIGDTFDYITGWAASNTAPIEFSATIDSISPDGLFIDFTVTFGAPIPGTFTDVGIRATNDLQDIKFNFGLIENDEDFNILSKTVDKQQVYAGTELVIGGTPQGVVNLKPLRIFRDWVTGSCTAENKARVDIYTQVFEITHDFIINPFYTDGQLSNLENNPIIPPDFFLDDNCLKYVYELQLFTVLSNPTTQKTFRVESIIGNTGFFDENFNGFTPAYSVDSIDYTDFSTAEVYDGIRPDKTTNIEIVIDKTSAFVGTQKVGVFVSALPPSEDYTDKTTDFINNFIYDNGFATSPGSGAGLDFITNIDVNAPVSDKVTIEFQLTFSTAQQALIESGYSYFIGILIEDNSKLATVSDRVMVLCDVQPFDLTSALDLNPLVFLAPQFDIYPHGEVLDLGSFYTDIISRNESGVVINAQLTLNIGAGFNGFLNTLKFILFAYDSVNDLRFNLDEYTFDLSGVVISNDIQQIEIDTTRGYNLPEGDQFNRVEMTTGNFSGSVQTYDIEIGQKFSWETWIRNLLTDPVFYDNTKPNDNLNFKGSNYSALNGYEIKMGFLANVTGESVIAGVEATSDVLVISPDLTILDYDDDGEVSPILSSVIELFRASNMSAVDKILIGEDTFFRSTLTSTSPITSLSGVYGIHRIEESGDTGKNIEEMSSDTIPSSDSSNLLKLIPGETKLKMSLVSGDVITECLIDGNNIEENKTYNVSSEAVVQIPTFTLTVKTDNTGTTDGTTANKLVDSTQNFLTTVSINDIVHDTTSNVFAKVTNVDSDTTLSLSADIMVGIVN